MEEVDQSRQEMQAEMKEIRARISKIERKVYGTNLIVTRLETFVVDKLEHTDKVIVMIVAMFVAVIFLLLFICLFFLAFLLQKRD